MKQTTKHIITAAMVAILGTTPAVPQAGSTYADEPIGMDAEITMENEIAIAQAEVAEEDIGTTEVAIATVENEESGKKKSIFQRLGLFLKNSFKDMGESAKAQREVDKAEFAAVKAESKANFMKATAKGQQKERDEKIKAANERREAAEKEIEELSK